MSSIDEILSKNSKIQLDIGCGANKQSGWVGMDIRPLPGVDIVHDIEEPPWPLPDNCARIIQASHIMEHIQPVSYYLEKEFTTVIDNGVRTEKLTDVHLRRRPGIITFMDEMWRVLEHDGQVWITAPHGWSSGFIQDPTHCKPLSRALFEYFTPANQVLYNIYNPKPWKIIKIEEQLNANILAVLNTIKEAEDDESPIK